MKTSTLAFDAERVATRTAQAVPPLSLVWRAITAACRALLPVDRYDPIDAATLRDLGIDRSELASFQAEADGRAALTRLRVDACR
jgi:hypothetical protein